MQLPNRTGTRIPILSYAPADIAAANRWRACRALPTLLTGSLLEWISAIDLYGLVYGGISTLDILAAFILASMLSLVSFVMMLVLACAIFGPRIEPRSTKAILIAALLPPALWLLFAWAQLHHRPSADALLLLLGSVFVVPLLAVRRSP